MSAITVAETEATSAFDDRIARCAENVMKAIRRNHTLRVPREEPLRSANFTKWLSQCREKYGSLVRQEWIRCSFPTEQSGGAAAAESAVWAQVEAYLRDYALRGLAAGWASRKLGDAVTLQTSEPFGSGWRVPIGVAGYGERLGQIVLDNNGNIVQSATTSRDALLEKNRDYQLSPFATAADQQ